MEGTSFSCNRELVFKCLYSHFDETLTVPSDVKSGAVEMDEN